MIENPPNSLQHNTWDWKSTVLLHFLQNLRSIQNTTDVEKMQMSFNRSIVRALHVYEDHTVLLADTVIPPFTLVQYTLQA